MPGEAPQIIEAGEWFDRLPNEADRRTVTGVVAFAHEFGLASRGYEYGSRLSNNPGYLAVYAVGSRSTGQEEPGSDMDILVAHNMSFGSGVDGRRINYMRGVDFASMGDDTSNWTDRKKKSSGYEAACKFEREFGDECLEYDPVSNAASLAIALASDNYRLPDTFSGKLPDTYSVGGVGHKVMTRYKAGTDISALDMIFYKGWHRNKDRDPSDEDIEKQRALMEDTGEKWPLPEKSACTDKCTEAGYNEGASSTKFEEIIDTDENGNQLPRVPLYTMNGGVKTIHIPQIRELIVAEQLKSDARDGYRFKPSWACSSSY